jgi:hypothetical protein
MQKKAHAVDVRVPVETVDAFGVKCSGPLDDAVHLITLAEQELGEIRAVLSGDAGDERFFHFANPDLPVIP